MAKASVATKSSARGPVKAAAPKAAKKEPAINSVPEPDSAAPESNVITLPSVGSFYFAMETVADIPAGLFRSASALELPFKHWFPQMGHNAHIFLPRRFWTAPKAEGGREVAEDAATSTYVRSKVRDAFRKWQATDEQFKNRVLILVERKAGDCGGEFKEDGFSVYLQINK
jgi:hypothetical protein